MSPARTSATISTCRRSRRAMPCEALIARSITRSPSLSKPRVRAAPAPPATATANQHHEGRRGHTGRIVAGTLVGGFFGAVALVAGPFAGAQERVITGSVLMAFAVAWAMLAFLSERWTDQPQRWAFVPAAFMAVCGTVVLVVA